MKRLLYILLALTVAAAVSSCSAGQGFKITSCSVQSLTPSGLRAVKAVLNLGVTNPGPQLTISKITGTVMDGEREFAAFEAGKVTVARRSSAVYPLSCSGSLSKGIGLSDLLKLASSKDFEEMTVDLTMRVRLRCGLGKTLKFKNIKILDLIEGDIAAAYLDMIINELAV